MIDGADDLYNRDTVLYPRPERQVAVRYRLPIQKADRCALANSFRFQEGVVLNIDAGGVGLMLPGQVEVGTKVFLQLKSKGSNHADGPELAAKVSCTAPHQAGGWLVWCNLKNPLSEEQLQTLL